MLKSFLRNDTGSAMLAHCMFLGFMALSAVTVAHKVTATLDGLYGRLTLSMHNAAAGLPVPRLSLPH